MAFHWAVRYSVAAWSSWLDKFTRAFALVFILVALPQCSTSGFTEDEGQLSEAAQPLGANWGPKRPRPAETRVFEVQLPAAVTMAGVAVGAAQALDIGQHAQVSDAQHAPALIFNAGHRATLLESGAETGDVVSLSDVVLQRRAQVTGNVRSAGRVFRSFGARVSGTIEERAAIPLSTFSWSVTFPASGENLVLRPGQERLLSPGSYGAAKVKAWMRLRLSAGTYTFDELELERRGGLVLDTSAGPIFIYVRQSLQLGGDIDVIGTEARVLLGYAGTSSLTIESALPGTLVAPWARVQLGRCLPKRGHDVDHRGAVFGKSVELATGSELTLVPFAGWETPTTLTVHTYTLDESAADQRGPAAGAGAYIRIAGETVGVTGDDGTLTVPVSAGQYEVTAIIPSFARGDASAVILEGEQAEIDIILDDSKEVIEPSSLILEEAPEGVLESTATSVTLLLHDEGTPITLDRVEQIELLDRNGDLVGPLDSLFTLAGDVLIATDLAALRAALQPLSTGKIGLRVTGVDALGFTYSSSVEFRLGLYRLLGTLTAPPSNPTLAVGSIDIEVKLLGTPVTFARTTDENGQFEIASVPIGNIGFDSHTSEGGIEYYGQATLFLTGNRAVQLVMRSVTDVINGVPPLVSGPLSMSSLSGEGSDTLAKDIAARSAAEATLTPPVAPVQSLLAGESVSVTATAAGQGVPVSATATLTVPQGTQTVNLRYNIYSAEYPYYVLQQSIYNDVWSLAVYAGAGGQQLSQVTRNVNSQLFTEPVWQADSTTGDITQVLDVSALTASGETSLTLTASSTNVGDSLLTTIVRATLTSEAALTIDEITADTVSPTVGDSSYYSIPRPGATNHYERWFTLKVTKPSEATISQVRTILRGPGDLMTILDEAPGTNVVIVDDEHIRVRVSLHDAASTINSTPPPSSNITYRFRVQADLDGATLEDERDSAPRNALWRMPDGIARYGGVPRDVGGDDWASRGCYNWLVDHTDLITRIDDISGEHARNIGHQGHARGVDIDQFHYYTFPGATSGGDNYTQLKTNVFAALRGDAAALGRVGAWVTATRTGLDNLLALTNVSRLYYAIGTAAQQNGTPANGGNISLAEGWAQSLIRTGTYTATTGQVLDTTLGAWAEANSTRVTYNAIHNSHIHIALNSAQLAN